ncbi:MAG: hypothetical protein NPIRA04_04290 [Nitrospirales bacterium]|nr:MAG: hypothetical protein NPIRA04_04290 [Nitrospirales bacterium]
MLKIENLNENKVLTITVSGILTMEDYISMLPELEDLLKKQGVIRFYIRLEYFEGFELEALWEDIKFDYAHQRQYGKTAIVGSKKWEELGTRFSNLFLDAETKFFYEEHAKDAWDWVNR